MSSLCFTEVRGHAWMQSTSYLIHNLLQLVTQQHIWKNENNNRKQNKSSNIMFTRNQTRVLLAIMLQFVTHAPSTISSNST